MNEANREHRILEYDKILRLLATAASSDLTRREIAALAPSASPHIVKRRLAETTEAVSVIMRKGGLPLGNFPDVKDGAIHAEKGGSLSMRQLLEIAFCLGIARKAARFLQNDLRDIPILADLAEAIAPHRELEERIETAILSETEMADAADPALRRIRREIAHQNEAIRAKLNQIVTRPGSRELLQDGIVTMRQGRYVVPVKQEHRAGFPGIIHDRSATGATLFIEPQAIVNMNNELRELAILEEREIERILAALSAETAAVARDIINNQELLIKLDLIFAKGRLSADMKSTEARVNTEGVLRIKNGRHPLIPRDEVVPISLRMGGTCQTLIITGPNTGGKTVTLKTAGLFLLMTEAGLHVPADEGTEMPLMERVFADIGDEQSIEQSLSTFSSHMKNIVEITGRGDASTLALLDELGAGTDPAEGAALAIAVLERLKSRGVMTIATTHYSELKKFAVATEGVENASMEFDLETLQPTYRLRTGAPGRSNAFEISKKLGLPAEITERAASLLSGDELRFEAVIRSIEADRKAAERELDEATALKCRLTERERELERELQRLSEKKERILASAGDEAREIVRETKALFDALQKELRELPRVADEKERNRRLEAGRKRLREIEGKHRARAPAPPVNPRPVDPGTLRAGDRVEVLPLAQSGEVISPPDERGEVQVQLGRMKISIAADQLTRASDGGGKRPAGKGAQKANYSALYSSKVSSVSPSVNVHFRDLDSALAEVDKYLDDAFIAGLSEVSVIHGRGAGILRDGIRRMLKTHPHVRAFRRGDYDEGGDGVTICTLKV
ncbi:MAG: endonuclease MutS2 [Clostridiales Family XIII bacterium]|jgi:DNA mismatch repair protein MutS2|nr:endonuclease MutS2 [Clostridiales Family XIII bacterium]